MTYFDLIKNLNLIYKIRMPNINVETVLSSILSRTLIFPEDKAAIIAACREGKPFPKGILERNVFHSPEDVNFILQHLPYNGKEPMDITDKPVCNIPLDELIELMKKARRKPGPEEPKEKGKTVDEKEATIKAAEQAKIERERQEAAKRAKEESDRKAAEQERQERERQEVAKKEAEQQAARRAQEEATRKAQEEATRKAQEEATRKAQEEAARKAELERREQQEAARKVAEQQEAARKVAEQQEAARKVAEQQEAARKVAEQQEAARKAAEQEATRRAKEERERLAQQERQAREQREREQREREQREAARQEAARQEAARQEQLRQEQLRQEQLRQEAARQEAVRQEQLRRAQQERQAREQQERQERQAREQQERQERQAREQREREQREREQREREQREREQREREQREREQREREQRERQAREQQEREQRERQAREQRERQAREQQEREQRERQAREQRERQIREQQEVARQEQLRQEAVRRAQQERQAREQREQQEREAARRAQEEAARRAQEEAARRAQEEAARRAPAQEDPIRQAIIQANANWNVFLNNRSDGNLRNLLAADDRLAQLMENKHTKPDAEDLDIEVITGDRLKQNLESNNIETVQRYSQVRFIIDSEFAEPKMKLNMVLGAVPEDFAHDSKWFILYENGLVTSVLCYLSNRKPTDSASENDNMQSFSTRKNRGNHIYRSKGYNQILMKYASQYIKQNNKCKLLKLGIEHDNLQLIDVYRKVGFELMPQYSKRLWDPADTKNVYMKYVCSDYDTIKLKLPTENGGLFRLEPFKMHDIIQWAVRNDGTFNAIKGEFKFNDRLSRQLCGNYPDKTGSFRCDVYLTSLRASMHNASITFDALQPNEKLALYDEVKNLATLTQFNNATDYEHINLVEPKFNGIYKMPTKFTEGYKSGFYMNDIEYNTTDDDIKRMVAKRYYVIKESLKTTIYDGISLQDGIQKWRDAFYDLRFVFIRNLRDLVKATLSRGVVERRLLTQAYGNDNREKEILTQINGVYDIGEQGLTEETFRVFTMFECILSDCTHPHCYYKLDTLKNTITYRKPNGEDLWLDYLRDQKGGEYKTRLTNATNNGPFFSQFLLSEPIVCDPNNLAQNNFYQGIQANYILSWTYESLQATMLHELMHIWKDYVDLFYVLYKNYYGWINTLPRDIVRNEERKLEIAADILAFQVVSILLEHSSLTWDQKLDILRKAVPAICGGPGDNNHPPGNNRIDYLISIPYICEIMKKNNIGQIGGGKQFKYALVKR